MNPEMIPGHLLAREPELLFHPDRPQDRHVHPLRGLLTFGPYSRGLLSSVLDPIRIATIFPAGFADKVRRLFGEFELRHSPRERLNYLPEFPGFSRVFGVRLVAGPKGTHIQVATSVDEELASRKRPPHLVIAEALTRAMNQLHTLRHEYDILVIFLPDKWSEGFYGPEDDDFDLHDYIKALNASRSIATQIVQEQRALDYSCRASVMWRLGIALYTKAGGVPWKLADQDPDAAYIGISYAMKFGDGERPDFVTCCSQVFDSEGAGLEFVVYETGDVRIVGDNPFLSRGEMRRVMARSLALFQRRHGGRVPKRIVIHKTTEFKNEEIEGCFDAWTAAGEIDLYQVVQESLWRGVLITAPQKKGQTGIAGAYPLVRGTYLPMGSREVALWTQGDAPAAAGGKSFFKEGKGVPQPIMLRRFAGHGGWDLAVASVLGLTKMNWNNDALYDRLPVTMSFASTLARTVKRMPQIAPRPYEFRFFM